METPPAAAPGGGAEILGAAAKAEAQDVVAEKRTRKRSRYLSEDYETAILIDDNDGQDIATSPTPTKGEEEHKEDAAAAALLLRLQESNLAGPDLLAALLRCAASPFDPSPGGPGAVVDAGVLVRFIALHRASVLAAECRDTDTTTDHDHSKDAAAAAAAAAAGHGQGLLNTCGTMAVAANGSMGKTPQGDAIAMGHPHAIPQTGPAVAPEAGPKTKKATFALDAYKYNAAAAAGCSAQPAASRALGHTYGHHTGPAVAPEAGPKKRRRRRKRVALAHNAAAAASCSAQPATGIANSAPKVAKKKARNNSSGQGQHPGKPVALILDFAQGGTTMNHPRPSKEELLSTFRGFGSLVEPDADIGTRRARLVFRSSAAAEAAYSCAHTLGAFSTRRLQYLRPPPPVPKIPLTDVRKNLEKMIASLTGPSVLGREGALDLAGQMLCLMAKVDKTLCAAAGPGPSTATAAAHHH